MKLVLLGWLNTFNVYIFFVEFDTFIIKEYITIVHISM